MMSTRTAKMHAERYESGKTSEGEVEAEAGLNVGVGVGVEESKMMRRVVLKMDVRCVATVLLHIVSAGC
jgi:hypothetical protein